MISSWCSSSLCVCVCVFVYLKSDRKRKTYIRFFHSVGPHTHTHTHTQTHTHKVSWDCQQWLWLQLLRACGPATYNLQWAEMSFLCRRRLSWTHTYTVFSLSFPHSLSLSLFLSFTHTHTHLIIYAAGVIIRQGADSTGITTETGWYFTTPIIGYVSIP